MTLIIRTNWIHHLKLKAKKYEALSSFLTPINDNIWFIVFSAGQPINN